MTEPAANERALMRLHIETLFTHDARGRMVRVNEPGGKVAPRFFLGRTGAGLEWRLRDDLDESLAKELNAACRADARRATLSSSEGDATNYEELLARFAPIERKWTGPAFCFPESLGTAVNTVLVTEDNVHVLRPHLEAWLGDVAQCQPMLVVLADGHAVSICASVRIGAAAHEAGLETAAAFRRCGYAIHAATAWAIAVRALGRIPLYSTSWQNAASQAVAHRLGLLRYGIDLHIT